MSVDAPPATRPPGSPEDAAAGRRTGGLGRLLGSWEGALALITVVVLVVAALAIDGFGTSVNLTFLVLDLAPVLLVALPLTFVIMTGEIDLSVASTLGLSSAVMGSLWVGGMPIETIIPLCVLLGAVLGTLNGVFVTVFGLPSLAVTIGSLALFRGLALVVLGDRAVADFPRTYTSWVTGTLPGTPVPNLLLPLLVLVVVAVVVLHATPTGRAVVATGASDTAARFAGIATARLKFVLYVVTGAVSGLAGVLWTLRYSSARADNATGLELTVVAAVLLGGVSIFGGRGTLPGVVAAVVLLTGLQNALRLENVSSESLTVVTGALLIASVLAPNVARSARARRDAVRRRRRTSTP